MYDKIFREYLEIFQKEGRTFISSTFKSCLKQSSACLVCMGTKGKIMQIFKIKESDIIIILLAKQIQNCSNFY